MSFIEFIRKLQRIVGGRVGQIRLLEIINPNTIKLFNKLRRSKFGKIYA